MRVNSTLEKLRVLVCCKDFLGKYFAYKYQYSHNIILVNSITIALTPHLRGEASFQTTSSLLLLVYERYILTLPKIFLPFMAARAAAACLFS